MNEQMNTKINKWKNVSKMDSIDEQMNKRTIGLTWGSDGSTQD